MAGYLGNSFLPARAGEVRSYIINSRSSLTKTYVFTTALSGRMMDAIVLVLASSMVLLGVNPKPSWLGDMSRTTAVIAGAGLLTIAIVPHTGHLVERLLRRIPMPRDCALACWTWPHRFFSACAHFTAPRGSPVLASGPGDLVRGLRFRTAGHSRPWDRVAVPGGTALNCRHGFGKRAALDARVCGYLSVRHVSVLTPFGVPHDDALAYSFVSQAMGYVVVLALGLPVLFRLKDWRQAIAATAPGTDEMQELHK